MGKKKSKPKKKAVKIQGISKEEPQIVAPEEGNFDFGGLPDRDLKKNLGCGS